MSEENRLSGKDPVQPALEGRKLPQGERERFRTCSCNPPRQRDIWADNQKVKVWAYKLTSTLNNWINIDKDGSVNVVDLEKQRGFEIWTSVGWGSSVSSRRRQSHCKEQCSPVDPKCIRRIAELLNCQGLQWLLRTQRETQGIQNQVILRARWYSYCIL